MPQPHTCDAWDRAGVALIAYNQVIRSVHAEDTVSPVSILGAGSNNGSGVTNPSLLRSETLVFLRSLTQASASRRSKALSGSPKTMRRTSRDDARLGQRRAPLLPSL